MSTLIILYTLKFICLFKIGLFFPKMFLFIHRIGMFTNLLILRINFDILIVREIYYFMFNFCPGRTFWNYGLLFLIITTLILIRNQTFPSFRRQTMRSMVILVIKCMRLWANFWYSFNATLNQGLITCTPLVLAKNYSMESEFGFFLIELATNICMLICHLIQL